MAFISVSAIATEQIHDNESAHPSTASTVTVTLLWGLLIDHQNNLKIIVVSTFPFRIKKYNTNVILLTEINSIYCQ